ncbi:MAG: hypothetical protein OXM61_18095 [Candidatus Poribacteria bacterium]|nr:hypothetical protein [Candidatus Poribacteria bacterium]
MKRFLVPTCVVLCVIGIFAVWYFGHQRSNQKELKSGSKDSVLIENHPQEESSVPEATQKTGKDDAAREIETKRDDSNPEKVNAAGGTAKNAVLEGGKEHQKLSSAEEVAAANAFEAYVKVEIEFDFLTESLKEALEASTLDWEHIDSVHKDRKDAMVRRKEALQNLAVYSEAAAEILAAEETLSAEDAARIAAIKEELEREGTEMIVDEQKRSAGIEEMRRQIEEMRKQIFDGFSPEQQRTLLDELPDLKELLNED